MTAPGRRADFNARTRRVLAMRAAYRCSNPSCSAVTVGPGAGAHDVTVTGTAAHIYPAAHRSPRGGGDTTAEQRRHVSNGIWLCADCGRLVDANDGRDYPPSLLHSWRDLQESRIKAEQKGRINRFGWIHALTVADDVWVNGPQSLRLSRCNLIIGENGAGKSCLASLLSIAQRPDQVMRRSAAYGRIEAVVEWLDPQPRRMSFVADRGALHFTVDGRDLPMVPRPFRSITLSETYLRYGRHDVDGLARTMGLDRWTVASLLPHVARRSLGRIVEVKADGSRIAIRTRQMDRARTLEGVSGGEQIWLVIELAGLLADIQADVEPVVLILDSSLGVFDSESRKHAMAMLASPERSFQTIVLTTPGPAIEVGPEWLVTTIQRALTAPDRRQKLVYCLDKPATS
jgi:hypothetical protein